MSPLRLGTRGSQLALWQARAVAAEIRRHGGPSCEVIAIKTTGDHTQAPLAEVGGKRLFVKEIEDALLQRDIDVAVHSAKDLPAVLPPGLALASVLPREDPRDALVLAQAQQARLGPAADPTDLAASLGLSPRVGTSSVRRVAQLTRLFQTPRFEAIRGNLDTRLRKLDAGEYDVLALAVAGLHRLGLAHRLSATLPLSACVPAPGQGAIAVETRADATGARAAVEPINHAASMAAVRAERALVAALGGDCQVPIGAIAESVGQALTLQVLVISLDGRQRLRHEDRGPMADPEALGERAAERLLADGAGEILEDARRAKVR